MKKAFTVKPGLVNALRALATCLCVLAAGRMHGGEGLFAVAGVPLSSMGDHSAVVLYRVEDGGLAKVRTVATRKQNPLLVRSYPQEGFAFVVSDGAFEGSFLVDILDLGDISHERSFDFDVCAGCVFVRAHLLQRNGRIVFYIVALADVAGGKTVSHYLGLEVHSGEFVHDIDRADATHLVNAGGQSGGVDGSDYMNGIYVRERAPQQPYVMSYSETFDLRWRLPDWFSLPEGATLVQVANNDHLRVLRTVSGTEGNGEWLVFDKSTGHWSSTPQSTIPASGDVRLIGRWLVREDVQDGVDHDRWREVAATDVETAPPWPAYTPRGEDPFWSVRVRSDIRRRTPTGRLQFYDTRTESLVVHDTGNLDSETLLIDESDAVYFRVGDELRRADMRDGGLVNGEVVAKAPELLAVHWLFRGFD